jgi:hypothetical protein
LDGGVGAKKRKNKKKKNRKNTAQMSVAHRQ